MKNSVWQLRGRWCAIRRYLILDDCTSALDARTEERLWDALHEVMPEMTCFVVTHRTKTLRMADKILLFDDGKVIDRGTHDELMARSASVSGALFPQRTAGTGGSSVTPPLPLSLWERGIRGYKVVATGCRVSHLYLSFGNLPLIRISSTLSFQVRLLWARNPILYILDKKSKKD